MHKKLKHLTKNIKEVFKNEEIEKIAKEKEFIKRKSSITSVDFLAFTVFYGENLCNSSLSQLASKYDAIFNASISKQALNKRFNKYSVEFMKEIFNKLLYMQNNTLKSLESSLRLHFNRVIINDSTGFALPENFEKEFPGAGGSGSSSSIKIQLQYELLSGSFMRMDICEGTNNDAGYLKTMEGYKEYKDLKLADLGYFKVSYLRNLDKSNSYFISKIKSNTALYKKNPNPEKNKDGKVKKSDEYIKIDVIKLAEPLAEGETLQLKNIYIGSKKELKSRLIVTKLSEENKEKREKTHKENIRKKRGGNNQQRINFNSINAYITNVGCEILTNTQVHEIYSLRWQIEIMFKVWKSIFKINQVKKVKMERFKCFLYGRLIALLLSSSIVFTGKSIILDKENKEVSEIKAFGNLYQCLPKLHNVIFRDELYLRNFLEKILISFKRFAIKSRKKGKKISLDILRLLKIQSN